MVNHIKYFFKNLHYIDTDTVKIFIKMCLYVPEILP